MQVRERKSQHEHKAKKCRRDLVQIVVFLPAQRTLILPHSFYARLHKAHVLPRLIMAKYVSQVCARVRLLLQFRLDRLEKCLGDPDGAEGRRMDVSNNALG